MLQCRHFNNSRVTYGLSLSEIYVAFLNGLFKVAHCKLHPSLNVSFIVNKCVINW